MRKIFSLVAAGTLLASVTACSDDSAAGQTGNSGKGQDLYVAPDPDDLYKAPDSDDLYKPPKMYVPAPPYTPPKMAPPDFKYSPPEMIHPDMKIKSTEKDVIIDIPERILFDTDSAVLRQEAYPALAQIAKSLSKAEHATFQINGHTDNRGTAEHNTQLSLNRAEAVKQALIEKFSLSSASLQTKGFGETQPVVPNDSPEHMQTNRRVEIVVMPTG